MNVSCPFSMQFNSWRLSKAKKWVLLETPWEEIICSLNVPLGDRKFSFHFLLRKIIILHRIKLIVSKPKYVISKSDTKSQIWYFAKHNFTLVSFWSPYLVEAINAKPNGPLYD
ncbi:hypothetical protein RJ641_016277 [Dillenia turbinata]|uniref:Uncharacterized protein n=1 Tax=Dillenia turbinata TaxID=194707 RepID=A0AAN8Z4H4_9MAGN